MCWNRCFDVLTKASVPTARIVFWSPHCIKRIEGGVKKINKGNTIVKQTPGEKSPQQEFLCSRKMHVEQRTGFLLSSTVPHLKVMLLQKRINVRNIELLRPNDCLQLLPCIRSSRQMCVFCNCCQLGVTRVEFLFTAPICTIKFWVCYDLCMNTCKSTEITLHKYIFWLQKCFSSVCLCTVFIVFTVT